jgi:hypothetical protein
MECKFSEFSYGYACIREAEDLLKTVYRSKGAPILPSLREEADLGYDAKLAFVQYVLLMQFKRSEFVSRSHPGSPTWPTIGSRHYRFSIDTDGDQHARLEAARNGFRAGTDIGEVFYVAPLFYLEEDLHRYYLADTVLENSILVEPDNFGVGAGIQPGRHHYAIDETGSYWILSDPRPPSDAGTWLDVKWRVGERAEGWQSPSRSNFRVGDLETFLLSVVEPRDRDTSHNVGMAIGDRLQYLAALLDCGLALVATDPRSN